MPFGTLEVLLVSAQDLENDDFFGRIDPYVILSYRSQDKKSTITSGTEPEWNETFVFSITSNDESELNLRVLDKDTLSADDFVGEAVIPLDTVFEEGSVPPKKYNVVDAEKEFKGEIKVGLTFTTERTSEDYGGGSMGSYGDSRRRLGGDDDSGERYGDDDNSRRGRGHTRERYGDNDDDGSRRNRGHSRERYGDDDSRRSYGGSRERYGDDDDGESYGDSRGSRGGWKESSRYEEDSYGGYKESSYRG